MSDNVIPFLGLVPSGSNSEVDEPNLTDIQLPAENVWMAAVTAAIDDNAVWGALLFVNADGDFCRIPIKTDHVSLRGLFEIALDDIKLD